MSPKRRKWLLIAAIPLVLAIAGVVVLKILFSGERLAALVIPRLETATGRTVSVGDITLDLFPSISLDIRQLSVSNREGEGFSADPMLSMDEVRVNVKLWPLLSSRLEVTSLEFVRPRLLIEINPAGSSNYEDPGGSAAEPDPPSSSPGLAPAPLLISDLRVHGAAVDYVNHAGNSATRVRNLDLAMDLRTEGGSFILSGTAATDSLSWGTVTSPLLSGLRITVAHRLRYDPVADLLTVEQGDLTLQNMRLSLSGTSSRNRTAPVLDFTLGSDSLNIADLFSLLPAEQMDHARGARGNGLARVKITVTGTITDSTEAEYRGRITAAGAQVHYPGLPRPITDITILSSFTRTAPHQEFRVDELTARLGGRPLHLTMTLVNFEDPAISLTAGGSLDLGTLKEYYPLEQGTDLGGILDLNVRIAGRIREQSTLRASGALTFSDVSIASASSSTPLRNLNGSVKFTNDMLETGNLAMLIGRSDIALAGKVRNYLSIISADPKTPASSAVMTLRSRRMVMADLMAPAGTPSGPDSATATPPGSSFVLPAAEVTFSASIDSLVLEKFAFTGVRGSLRVAENVVRMQNLALSAFGGSVVSTGSLDLTTRSRPLFDLTLSLADLQAGQLLMPFTSFGRLLNGSLSMETSLSGALDDTLGIVPAALRGNGTVAMRNGRLTGFAVNEALAAQFGLPDLRTITFTDWTNRFTMENGRMLIDDATITAMNTRYVVNGSHGLDGTIDYRVEIFLPESYRDRITVAGFPGEAVDLFKDESGRLKLEVNAGGTQDNPKLRVVTDSARRKAEELARQKLDEEKRRLENQLRRKGEDLLKNLFKKDSTQP